MTAPRDETTNWWRGVVAGVRRPRAGSESTANVARFLVYAGLGVAVGLLIVVIEWVIIEQVLHALLEAPLYVQLVAPGLGLVITAIILRLAWDSAPTTSDIYVQAFHGTTELEPRRLLPKLSAALATVGLGGAAGLEGPSIYAGSNLGQWLSSRRLKILGERSGRIMLAAGAAAGVAAIFRAPATGVLFALEAPFRRDIARHALIPALIASAASYVTFVLILDAERLLRIRPTEVPLTDEVLGAIVIGLLGGAAARGIAGLFHYAKDLGLRAHIATRIPVAAVVLAGSVLIANALVDLPVTLGPGAEAITEVVLDPTISVWVIVALFFLRAVATSATLGAGGVGGVFIPLVVQGLLLGRVVETIFGAPSTGLYPVIGLAAVLGAGYRTPLAAVMFVAETTGRAEFVIPALLATAVSQSLMGDVSVSKGQADERGGQLEERLRMATSLVTVPLTGTLRANLSLLQVIDELDPDADPDVLPVVHSETGRYLGLLVLSDTAGCLLDKGMDATVRQAMRAIPGVAHDQPALEAARTMSEYNTAAVAVLDDEGKPVGIVTPTSLAGLDDLF